MMSKTLIVVIIAVGLAAALILGSSFMSPGGRVPSTSVYTTPATVGSSPPQEAPLAIATFRGTVRSVNSTSLVVEGQGGVKTSALANTKDVQKLTAGSLERGDAKTEQTNAGSVQVGQEVLVISDKDLNAVSILIIR